MALAERGCRRNNTARKRIVCIESIKGIYNLFFNKFNFLSTFKVGISNINLRYLSLAPGIGMRLEGMKRKFYCFSFASRL